jgi:glycerol uptake facilitator-like aquaporin
LQLGAEFVGTFILIFMATAGPIVNQKYNGAESLLGNAACAGLAVMAVILSTGHISGAHLNPSLTIAFAALRHFPWLQVPAYIAAQVSGSICASFALKGVFHPYMSGGVTVPSVSNGQAFALEFIITFNLLFVVTAVATDTRAVRIYILLYIYIYIYIIHHLSFLMAGFILLGGRVGRYSSWSYRFAQHSCGRVSNLFLCFRVKSVL